MHEQPNKVDLGQSRSWHISTHGIAIPRMIAAMPKIASIAFILLFCASAFGQASRVDIPLQTSGPNVPSGAGPLPQALWVSNAKAYVCTHPSVSLAACQANPITTYTDSTGGTPCNAATPLVQLPGSTCTASTGVTSNLGLWYAGGAFDYYVTASYGTFGPYTYNVPVSGGTVTGLATIANIAALRAYNGNATSLNVIGYYSANLTSPPDGGGGIFIDQGAGASADDGGVTIYDSATGHNWKRLIPVQGTIIDAWFGVKADNSTDNAATIQAGWNYMCSARAGKFMFQNGSIRFGSHITKNCSFDVSGTGGNPGGAIFGTNLIYTGTEGYAISYDTQRAIYTWTRDSMHDFGLTSTMASPTTWTNAIQLTNPNASQLLQGTFERISFNNWTGAALYWHVTPFSVPTSTITAYISDGTGSAPGHVLCVTSGSVTTSQTVTGSGVPSGTLILLPLSSGQAEFPVTCTGGGGGTPWLVTTSSNISSESMPVGFDSAPYAQAVTMRDIFSSGIGQAIGSDVYAGPELNQFLVENWDQENAQSVSAGVAPYFFDLAGMAGIEIKNFTYDGSTDASPAVVRVGRFGLSNRFPGMYVETGSASHPLHNIVETAYGTGQPSIVSITDGYFGGCTYCTNTLLVQPYGGTTTLESRRSSGYFGVGYVDNTKNSKVFLDSDIAALDSTTLGWTHTIGGALRAQTTNTDQAVREDTKSVPFIDVHGAWLDGLTNGPVTLTASGLAFGMVTDATEGRVFEVESANNGIASLNIGLANLPADWKTNEVSIAIHMNLRTTQTGYWSCLLPSGAGAINTYAASGNSYGGFSCNILPINTWYTLYFIGQIPAGATSLTLQFVTGASSPAPTGTQFLDIASIYVGAGSDWPYTLGGGAATQTVNFKCAAAPTYGTYIVGDSCSNSAPTGSNVARWVNTSAGSPGTFTPISTNPTVTCGTTTTCSNTAQTAPRTVWGTVALSSGSPSTAVVTAMTAFTATTSFVCTGNDRTTPATSVSIVNTSTSSITITGPNTVTDSIGYVCVGN